MSVTDTNVVDMIGTIPDTDLVVLSISDHLEWGAQSAEHLLMLQNKINTYLRFIESGEIYTAFPSSKGKSVVVRVYFKYEPDDMGNQFMSRAEEVLRGAGIELQTARVGSELH
jgi:hypothetical protein